MFTIDDTRKTPSVPPSPRKVLAERRERLIQEQRSVREHASLTTFGGVASAAGTLALFLGGLLAAGAFTAVLAVGAFVVRWRQARSLNTLKSDLDYLETVELIEENPS